MRKKKKIPCHTFLVYKSGKVTQSGPIEKLNEQVYYKFLETVLSIRQQVEKKQYTEKVRFVPKEYMCEENVRRIQMISQGLL